MCNSVGIIGVYMKVKKNQLLRIRQPRRYPKNGWVFAEEDFDTDEVEFYPVKNALRYLEGMANEWYYGDHLPSRKDIDTLFEVSVQDIKHQLDVTNRELEKYPEDKELKQIKGDLELALQVQRGEIK